MLVALLGLFLSGLNRPDGRETPRILGKAPRPGRNEADRDLYGFTSILFAYTSAVANNGQNFAVLSANSPFYNCTLTLAILAGRFGLGVTTLALAGPLAHQPRRLPTLGTLPTATPLFTAALLGTAIIVGALSFFPALALGPLVG